MRANVSIPNSKSLSFDMISSLFMIKVSSSEFENVTECSFNELSFDISSFDVPDKIFVE